MNTADELRQSLRTLADSLDRLDATIARFGGLVYAGRYCPACLTVERFMLREFCEEHLGEAAE